MKTYNITHLLMSDTSTFSYAFPITKEDGTTAILFTADEFKTIIKNQYTSFSLLSPGYYDPDNEQWVDIIPDTAAAITELHNLFQLWVKDRSPAISKLWEALRMKYNPIWNVDGVTGTIHQETHTGTDTDKKTGDVTNTGTSTTKNEGKTTTTDRGKTTTTNSGKSSNTKSGNETNEPTGQDVLTKAVTTYDDATFRDTEKDTTSFTTRKDTHTYNSVKDSYEVDPQSPLKEEYEVDSQNPLKSEYEVDSQNPLKETYQIDSQDPLKEKYNTELQKTLNLKDEILNMEIRQGNIGVVSTQSMLQQQLALTELDDIISYAIHDFVHRYLVILS